MLEDLDHAELREWERLYSIEPFGERRGDIQAAAIAAYASWAKKAPTVFSIFPWWGEQQPKQSAELMASNWARAVEGFNRALKPKDT
jgi:hypothetical protein